MNHPASSWETGPNASRTPCPAALVPSPWQTSARLLLAGLLGFPAMWSGCDDAQESVTPVELCVPSRADWEDRVAQAVDATCGNCHGSPPNFGAPWPLVEYDAIVEGAFGERRSDDILAAVVDGSMPPANAPAPDADTLDTIARWASCGMQGAATPTGLQVSRPPYQAPAVEVEGLEPIELTADDEPVDPDALDRYHEVEFTNVVDQDVFIYRMEPIVDASAVLHHLVFAKVGDGDLGPTINYLYTWAPGTGSIGFPDGGVRLRPGDTLLLEIHYNNGAGLQGVRDSSGVRLWVGPTSGTEYGMVGPGPGATGFTVAPQSEAAIESTCVVTADVSLVATMPHMHAIGRDFELELRRGEEPPETLLKLERWEFETQLFYELPVALKAGDALTVRCHYANPNPFEVSAGQNTLDEMCFAFTYTTPALDPFCEPPQPQGFQYSPGLCIDSAAGLASPNPVIATYALLSDGPAFEPDGQIPDGQWSVDSVIVSADGTFIQVAEFEVAGQLIRTADVLSFDADLQVVAPGMTREDSLSIRGVIDGLDFPGPVASPTCEDSSTDAPLIFGTVDGRPAARLTVEGIGEVYVWMLLAPNETP